MDNAEWKSTMQDMQEGSYPKKKKKSVADQFVVKYSSETYWWTQKLNREDYGVDKWKLVTASVSEAVTVNKRNRGA
jgi:hypothetical protein